MASAHRTVIGVSVAWSLYTVGQGIILGEKVHLDLEYIGILSRTQLTLVITSTLCMTQGNITE